MHNISVYKVLYFAEGIFCLDHGYSCQAPVLITNTPKFSPEVREEFQTAVCSEPLSVVVVLAGQAACPHTFNYRQKAVVFLAQ